MGQKCGDVCAIVSDDCGPESAADLVRSFDDPRILYRRNPTNLGLAGNWNACLDAAPTDLVTLLHADDELLPDYAHLMTAAASRDPDAVAFFCQARIIDHDSQSVFSLPDYVKRFLIPSVHEPVVIAGEPGLTRLLRGNFITCPTLCYRKSRLGSRRFASRWKMVLDLDLTANLLLAGEHLVGLPDVAYSYRRHSSNQTSQLTASLIRFQEEVAFLSEFARHCRDLRWRRAAFAADWKVMVSLNLAYCVLQDLARLRPRQAWSKAAFLRDLLGV